MKICKDGRIWGQNNKEAYGHLGFLAGRKQQYIRKGTASESKMGNKNPMFGKTVNQKGSNNSNWRGGISSQHVKIRNQIEYKLWREAVYARDNWTCQECGKKQGGRLNAHHIKSFVVYPELRFAIDNGRTLCRECHKLTENYKGGKSING